jgi:hypothetical protein
VNISTTKFFLKACIKSTFLGKLPNLPSGFNIASTSDWRCTVIYGTLNLDLDLGLDKLW